jgi:hypothetical protein
MTVPLGWYHQFVVGNETSVQMYPRARRYWVREYVEGI